MIPPPRFDPRYHALDLWRGLLCLLVVVEHAAVALWGDQRADGLEGTLRYGVVWFLQRHLGTPLFFVISGYCIAASLDASRRKGTSPARFLARRFWRIFPPYWAALLAFVAGVAALDALGLERLHRSAYALELGGPGELNGAQWVGNLTLTETWRPLFWGKAGPAVFTRVAWSLCYQEQFYLVGFLALVLAPRRLHAALAMATVATVLVRVAAWDSGMDHRLDGLFPIYWHEFAVGLAVFWRLNVAEAPALRRLLDLALAALLGVAAWCGPDSTIASSAFGLALIAAKRFDESWRRLDRLDPLRWLGRRSYSVYLIHLPVCVVGNAVLIERVGLSDTYAKAYVVLPAVTAAALAAGCLFHRLIDVRFHALPAFPTLPAGAFRALLNRPITPAGPSLLGPRRPTYAD